MPKQIEDFATEFNLDDYDIATIKELLRLNDGKIRTVTLRSHLSKGYATCARLAEVLVENGLAQHPAEDEKMRYVEVRKKGWHRNA